MSTLSSVTSLALAAAISISVVACSIDASPTESTTSSNATEGAKKDAGPPTYDGYPAFTPSLPTLSLHGGKILASPKVQLVHYKGDSGASVAQSLIQKLGASNYWRETTAEYGVTGATALPVVALEEAAPETIDGLDVQAWLVSQLDGANDAGLATPDEDTVYVWTAPPSTKITSDGDTLCEHVGGYHAMVRRSNGHYVPFIVLPQCATIGELKGADALTYALSHELIEAATDPFATGWLTSAKDLAWKYILIGGEAGDLCEVGGHSIRVDELDAVVQRSWSNAAAAAGHEPCVPAGDAVGFGAFAATPDTYKDATTTYSTIKLPMGESRAIDVSIYSDAPMSDLKIYAWDGAAMNGRKTELQLSFPNDKAATHGKNGDVIPLIVKAVNPGSFNGMSVLTIVAESPDGRTQKLWAGLVTH